MLELVNDRVTTGMTTVVGTAAVLRLEKQMENCHIIGFSGWSFSYNKNLILTCAENGQSIHVFVLTIMTCK
jgi:hypothetical protein